MIIAVNIVNYIFDACNFLDILIQLRPEFSVEIYLWHKIFGCQSNVKQLPLTGKNDT